jgi:hypothetical protein
MPSVRIEQIDELLNELEENGECSPLQVWQSRDFWDDFTDAEMLAASEECERVYRGIIAEVESEWGPPDFSSPVVVNPGDWNEGVAEAWPRWCEGDHLTYWRCGEAVAAVFQQKHNREDPYSVLLTAEWDERDKGTSSD